MTDIACQGCGVLMRRAAGNHARCCACAPIASRTIQRAGRAVKRAVLDGRLLNLKEQHVPCADCGGRADRYDHRDYSTPLAVEPVCHRCNVIRGPGANVMPARRRRSKRQSRAHAASVPSFKGVKGVNES